jgi:hypothetical protein
MHACRRSAPAADRRRDGRAARRGWERRPAAAAAATCRRTRGGREEEVRFVRNRKRSRGARVGGSWDGWRQTDRMVVFAVDPERIPTARCRRRGGRAVPARFTCEASPPMGNGGGDATPGQRYGALPWLSAWLVARSSEAVRRGIIVRPRHLLARTQARTLRHRWSR